MAATRTLSSSAADTPQRVADVLASGGVVLLPTDTVYGLVALPADADATARVFALKGRAADVPMAVLCETPEAGLALARSVPEAARQLADVHWPGPLTLVLQRRPGLDWHIGDPADTVGVRCPDHPLLRAVTALVGPVAATSANHHGLPTPDNAADAAASLTGEVDLVVDGGLLPGTASSVIDATGEGLRILRSGPITLDPPDRGGAPLA